MTHEATVGDTEEDGDTGMEDAARRMPANDTHADQMEEEEEERAAHMQWKYKAHDGKMRHWTATRPIDTLREPAPYLCLF
jgi:hypothetical protein